MKESGSTVRLKTSIRQAIYALKFKYGFPIDLYKTTEGGFDPETGRTELELDKIHIVRAIVFPGDIHRDIFQTISFIKANSNFITGGDIELTDRQMIIDGRDLPRGYDITVKHYIVWDNERYSIHRIQRLEANTGYFLNTRKIENEHAYQIHDSISYDYILVDEGFDHE